MSEYIIVQIATQSVSSARETRVGKKGRRGSDIVANRFVLLFCYSFGLFLISLLWIIGGRA